ncbi:MAG: hypothetical protein ACXVR0_17680, partial [Solirubrobacteraceae bacterium]
IAPPDISDAFDGDLPPRGGGESVFIAAWSRPSAFDGDLPPGGGGELAFIRRAGPGAVQCGAMQRDAARCGAMQRDAARCGAMRRGADRPARRGAPARRAGADRRTSQ